MSSELNLVRKSVSPLMAPTMMGVEGSLVDSSSSCRALHSVSATLGASFCIHEGNRADSPPSEEYNRPRTVALRADFLRPNSENKLHSSTGGQASVQEKPTQRKTKQSSVRGGGLVRVICCVCLEVGCSLTRR